MFGLGPVEMLIVGVIAVLLFGNRLPEVGRSLGKGLIEFKKGLRDIQSEVNLADTAASSPSRVSHHNPIDETDEATAPKFVPPTREPVATTTAPSDTADSTPV
ncbi:MAG TPA: twin-arginine translocase TatA/TatE family subunit, partial [Pirellulales bacterium]